MKIFSWMQSKLNAKQVARKPNTIAANNHMGQATSKEEFSDWPQSLLAIGTFGISNLKSEPERERPEEDGELQEELMSFLDTEESGSAEEAETHEPPHEQIVNRDIFLQRSISGIFSRGMKDILVDQKNVIKKKSLTFLLKKFFTTRNRFNHARDSLNPTMDKSRMEKILRAILNKKIHPQSSVAKALPNKNLAIQDISMDDEISDAEDDNEGSTWVKTDSEYIVLEI
ncbi:hypothetical protein L1887_03494 [Cichorium endivia]|nr:hypothetical protein L1887_03494 [Cichorium endivia]